ncbi:hypothetical protein EVAR_89706_1 [Eumeta japonica]|uniref:Uncharacterized protein n=1 Tax=Eumeta variegata TaxID=151549 RepID=A0A4C1WYD6_EUMVA|nr:hypothetical protein EVAR_89706_1 [Eumeta japonica]
MLSFAGPFPLCFTADAEPEVHSALSRRARLSSARSLLPPVFAVSAIRGDTSDRVTGPRCAGYAAAAVGPEACGASAVSPARARCVAIAAPVPPGAPAARTFRRPRVLYRLTIKLD